MKFPRSFSHIDLSVPNLDKAVKFYNEVMELDVVMEPSTVTKKMLQQ
jgi:catechol 2,3-dioxygenase-like lactoylglutathione lyase family enzyme